MGAQVRIWVPVARVGGLAVEYVAQISGRVRTRAIALGSADFPAEGAWYPWVHLFATPLGDDLAGNIVISGDESVLARLYTQNLVNVAVLTAPVRPAAIAELRRWHVWTAEPWSLADYYLNTRWVPPLPHTLANALVPVVGMGEPSQRDEDLVQTLRHEVDP